jgi:hypothetical protein
MINRKIWLVLGFWMTCQILTAQFHELLDDFRVYKDGDRVILTWTISSGSTCIGTGILRSIEPGVEPEVIGELKEVCGSLSEPKSYTFIDENPVSGKTNYYTLELGFSGRSAPALGINFISLDDNNYKVVPHPIKSISKIYFENKNKTQHTLVFYDSNGKYGNTVHTNDDHFIIDITEKNDFASTPFVYLNNLFVFNIFDNNGQKIASGRFLGFE